MAWEDRTDMGGEESRFQTTHWTQVFAACSGDPSKRAQAMGWILGRYWRPVYCYLRRRGYQNEEAKDLVQGFFHEVVLRRDLLRWASQEKGRFRTLLLHALRQHCSSVRRNKAARKRHPAGLQVQLDAATAERLATDNPEADPEQAYHYSWASQLLDEVLLAVRAGCNAEGMEVHWHVFRERVLEPILTGAARPSLPTLCERYRIPYEAKASNMIVTVKRRFQREMAQRIREVVGSEADVEEEILDLLKTLSRGSARYVPGS